MKTLTQVTRCRLMATRYQMAIVSNISEEDCHRKMDQSENEEMLPVTVVVGAGDYGDKIEDLQGVRYDFAITIDSNGEVCVD